MDAPDREPDVKLQRESGDLIAELDRALGPFLRKKHVSGRRDAVRSRVRVRDTGMLVKLLEPFQELPQLLDPHLSRWLPMLGEAYLEYLQLRPSRSEKAVSAPSKLLCPLSAAICSLLYTFCKIRGEKVVVRFLNNEPRYLELLLSALEEAERRAKEEAGGLGIWTWEERYVALLWLSHLLLAPFDLATMSSVDMDDEEAEAIPNFTWPKGLPGMAIRVVPLAIEYLASPGKERDAAKLLLVRISSRRDMQQLHLLDALVKWSLGALRSSFTTGSDQRPYYPIGILSYLAGILDSLADSSDMESHLTDIFSTVHHMAAGEGSKSTVVSTSALVRKIIIKLVRSVAVLVLRSSNQDMARTELIETAIGFLLESLADHDTPVRLAASKALSIITLKLHADMASQVVEAVLESLNRNVLHVGTPLEPSARSRRDLSAVDPLEWHGLMLTLAHLLYRRSPPVHHLPSIIRALLTGLSFEKRSASGSLVGANVRDAACFGIWALARRYTTGELLAVPHAALPTANKSAASVLQVVATDLIAAACLDPAGNIRRASSAALQELIGRHPDSVEKGVWAVQTVDYHGVALRSRAMQEVALGATKLSLDYGRALLDSLLGWRGIGDADAPSRRAAGSAYGALSAELAHSAPDPLQGLLRAMTLVTQKLQALQSRQVEERHGLLLSFAAVLDALPTILPSHVGIGGDDGESWTDLLGHAIRGVEGILTHVNQTTYRRPELIAEAASRLIVSSFPVFQAVILTADRSATGNWRHLLLPGHVLTSRIDAAAISKLTSTLDAARSTHASELDKITELVKTGVSTWLGRPEKEVIAAASHAGLVLLILCSPSERRAVIRSWADRARHRPSARTGTEPGYFAALAMSYPVLSTLDSKHEDYALVRDAILTRWENDEDTDTRLSVVQALAQTELLRQHPGDFLDLLAGALDDYTTSARGDVGSHVRVAGIRATKSLWECIQQEDSAGDHGMQDVIAKLFLRILRLAAEKLDRVRVEAHMCLSLALTPS